MRKLSIKQKELHEDLGEYLRTNLDRSKGSLDKILYYVDCDNYLQILYTYGIEAVQVLMRYFLEVEDYGTCGVIHETIKNYNKTTGKNLRA